MKLNCYPETNSLCIDLSGKTSVESREISAGVPTPPPVDDENATIVIDEKGGEGRRPSPQIPGD